MVEILAVRAKKKKKGGGEDRTLLVCGSVFGCNVFAWGPFNSSEYYWIFCSMFGNKNGNTERLLRELGMSAGEY